MTYDPKSRARALQSLLVEKGMVSNEAVDEVVRKYEEEIGPQNGAEVVARAWTEEEYKQRLLEDGTEAIAELGYGGIDAEHLIVVENTPGVHNVVVCTLCSCYPWAVLGLPPTWYKSHEYRSRMVREPRTVLTEDFGVELDDVEVKVWDSSSEVRYMVLPQRPEGTQGMSEEELAELVTRDAMIGVSRLPQEVG
jgi:nitrile hydratase